MRCPECGEEIAEGSTECAKCSTASGEGTEPVVQVSGGEAPTRPRRRLSRMAIIGLVAVCIAPWLHVLRDQAGGAWAPSDPATLYLLLTGFEVLGLAFFMLGILLGTVSLVQVVMNWAKLRGAALGLCALILGLGGMLGETLGNTLYGTPAGDVFAGMRGGEGIYKPAVTWVIVAAMVVIEIMLGLTGRRPPEPEAQSE